VFHVKQFDVIIIGGGHAGTEAAAASARMGARTALITLRREAIGVMSCNPAIGGLGKGHLVREIDAFDGIMGLAADRAGIQFRLLNRRKGPAVQGPRTQADRKLYRLAVQDLLSLYETLTVIEGEVARLILKNAAVCGVVLADNTEISAPSVVVTAGTFLNGIIHVGDQQRAGGRVGDAPSIKLAQQLAELDLGRGRLKTGTPPRLDGRTINWDILDSQPGDDVPTMFSFLSRAPIARQIACGVTHTNAATHKIIRDNLGKSAMYGGHISGVGPRYCPSIEDKVVRFADKDSHQIFLEPEGLDDHTIYPNGISTSLPADVQVDYVRSIIGLEAAVITQPGYAIEYDFFDPRGLNPSLQVKQVAGLFFAGQINGTTGYEEAAAQGLVAGLNAALLAKGRAPMHFSRTDSYIGVMLDDLTTHGVTEPYRMFTSRAEYRLTLRADNADQRLTQSAIDLGCVSDQRTAVFVEKMAALDNAKTCLSDTAFSPKQLADVGIQLSMDGGRRSALSVLAFADTSVDQIAKLVPQFASFDGDIQQQVARDALYMQYIARQDRDVSRLRADEMHVIPAEFDYTSVRGLSNELTTKLQRVLPQNVYQASKIEGMTPAALLLILSQLRRPVAVKQGA
jgi:tRNA uridine 5-carboxymethylaminomethyl modification enzyme